MYLCTRREIWTSFSCLVLLKCYHVVFSQFKIPANLAQLAVPKMHCLYLNAVVQPSVQHCLCYMAWETKVHSWCRHCHLCINAPMWREKRWLQGLFDPPSYVENGHNPQTVNNLVQHLFLRLSKNAVFLMHSFIQLFDISCVNMAIFSQNYIRQIRKLLTQYLSC